MIAGVARIERIAGKEKYIKDRRYSEEIKDIRDSKDRGREK